MLFRRCPCQEIGLRVYLVPVCWAVCGIALDDHHAGKRRKKKIKVLLHMSASDHNDSKESRQAGRQRERERHEKKKDR